MGPHDIAAKDGSVVRRGGGGWEDDDQFSLHFNEIPANLDFPEITHDPFDRSVFVVHDR